MFFLGNGFSRACKNDIFAYEALFDRANFTVLSPYAKTAFKVLGTNDFERVIEALRTTSKVLTLYRGRADALCATLKNDADGLRDVLVKTIAGSHPDLLSEINTESYEACRIFLSKFQRIFTLNYDLLLYWAVMQKELEPFVKSDDGFRTPDSGEEEYVTWEIDNNYNQTIYYLHGALHIFDAGTELQKYTWIHTGKKLTDQIRTALEQEKYPLFVAEGKSDEKLRRIKHNAYLTKAFDSFSRIRGALFMYGHSLSQNDEHFLKLIEKGGISQLFVSIFGDPKTPENKKIIKRAKQIKEARVKSGTTKKSKNSDLEVFFYDAQSASVWG
jgi:hypothetical protein